MSTYIVKLTVTVEVEVEIEATSYDSVSKLLANNLMMTASLVDAEGVSFIVTEDSISDLNIDDVSKA